MNEKKYTSRELLKKLKSKYGAEITTTKALNEWIKRTPQVEKNHVIGRNQPKLYDDDDLLRVARANQKKLPIKPISTSEYLSKRKILSAKLNDGFTQFYDDLNDEEPETWEQRRKRTNTFLSKSDQISNVHEWQDKFSTIKHEILTEVIFKTLGTTNAKNPTFNNKKLKAELKEIDEFWEYDPRWDDEIDMLLHRVLLEQRVLDDDRVDRYVKLFNV